MKSVNPYLNFSGNTEEVFTFYQSVFGGDLQILRFKDMGDDMGATGDDLNKIAHVALPLGAGTLLMGSDSLESMGQALTQGNNFYIHLGAESTAEAERLFDALSAGGTIEMPLQETEWSPSFGMCADRFGTRWIVDYDGDN